MKPTVVRLPEGMAERIDALVGNRMRAEFIREAIDAELRRRERRAAKDQADKT